MFRRSDPIFDNISLDLIYGIPGMSNEKWKQNIETALSFEYHTFQVML
jgi:coproporphyrinogen III oxidase-like Fe-S oxidoreductase